MNIVRYEHPKKVYMNTMICKLSIKPPVTICLQTGSEYSESAASILIEKGSQSTDRNMALSYTVSCPLSIIMKGAGTYKVFKIPKLILRSVLILMLGCEKHWHPLKHRTDKVRTPTSFSPPLQGQDTSHILLSKKLQIQLASLILVHTSSGEGSRKECCWNCVSLL